VSRGAYRPSSSSRGLMVVLLCILGSVGLHGVAYAVLRHIRKPEVEARPADDIIKEQKKEPPKKRRKVRLLKPRIPPMREAPMAPRPVPQRVQVVRRPPMEPPRTPPMEPPRPVPLDLTTPPVGSGVNPNLTASNGEGTVHVGSTALGDPTVAPTRSRPRPMRPAPMAAPPPPRRRAVVYLKREPVPVMVPQVPYPRAAKRANVEGTVKLEVVVGRDGRVVRVRVLKRLGYGLDEAAVRALKQARFRPAMGSDGKPMVYTIRYKYTFRLEQ
jgi:protein TonB